jgi:uncharacterized protein (DUF302 family)
MIQVVSQSPVAELEQGMAAAAQRHGASLLATTHIGALLDGDSNDAVVFTVCQADLYRALLGADVRFAAFLPCRIAALRRANGVLLESIAPREFCRIIHRDDLERLVLPLEDALRAIMEDAARPNAAVAAAHAPGGRWGATEDQVNMRATVAQRVDCHGTKIEDLGGTGKGEALGG